MLGKEDRGEILVVGEGGYYDERLIYRSELSVLSL